MDVKKIEGTNSFTINFWMLFLIVFKKKSIDVEQGYNKAIFKKV